MTNDTDRLRTWIERGSVTFLSFFFSFIRSYTLQMIEAMLLMHLHAFHEEGNEFPTPATIASRMYLTEDDIATSTTTLDAKGLY